jgi:hypothetical protein
VTFEAFCNRCAELRNRSHTGIDNSTPHPHFADLNIAGNSRRKYTINDTMLQIACSLESLKIQRQ